MPHRSTRHLLSLLLLVFSLGASESPPTTKPVETMTPRQFLDLVPPSLVPAAWDGWTDLKIATFNEEMDKAIERMNTKDWRPVRVQFVLNDVSEDKRGLGVFGGAAPDGVPTVFVVYYPATDENKKALARLERGRILVADGLVFGAFIAATHGKIALVICLGAHRDIALPHMLEKKPSNGSAP